MGIENVKDWIESLYSLYEKQYGEVMLNYFTNRLWDKVYSEVHCKRIIDRLTSSFPYPDKRLEVMNNEFFTDLDHIKDDKWQQYISFSIQKLLYERKKMPNFMHCEPYCDIINWTYLGKVDEHTKVMSFKTDFVRPIIDYVEDQLNSSSSIIEEIKRYKERVERFRTINLREDELKEEKLQDDIALYLFDKGYEYSREPNINKGCPDFVIMGKDSNLRNNVKGSEPLIIEVKLFKTTQICTKSKIEKSLKQVKDYSSQLGGLEYCLLIYTKNTDIFNKASTIINQEDLKGQTIILINLDGKMPSK